MRGSGYRKNVKRKAVGHSASAEPKSDGLICGLAKGKRPRGPRRGGMHSNGQVYLGVRVKMTVRDMLKNVRIAQGWGHDQLQDAFWKKEERAKTRSGLRAARKQKTPKSLEELAIIVEVLEEDLKTPHKKVSSTSIPPSAPPASPGCSPALTGYNSDSSDDIIPSPQHHMSYSPWEDYQSLSPDTQSLSSDYQSPSPDYHSLSPDYQSLSPDYQSPSPDYQSLSPDYQSLSPDYQSPSPDYQSLSPDYQSLSPDYQSLSPDYQSLSPDYQSPSPDYQSPSPDYQSPSPDYQSPSPDYQSLTTNNQTLSPDLSCSLAFLEEQQCPQSWSSDSTTFFWTQLQKEEMVLNNISDTELLATDEHGKNFLHNVVCVGKRALTYATAKRMAAINSLDIKDSYGMTALLYAAKNNHHLIVCDLIQLGASINERNNQGKSCLHLSVEKGYTQVLEILKQMMMDGYFVDVEAMDNFGMSVLQCAAVALKSTVCEMSSSSTLSSRLNSLRKEQMLETLEKVLQMGSYLHSMGCGGMPRSS